MKLPRYVLPGLVFCVASGVAGQSLPKRPIPQSSNTLGSWIADGETLPKLPDSLVLVPKKEPDSHRWMWHVESANSCAWCAPPMSYKAAAFDKPSVIWWTTRVALTIADIEITHRLKCFQAGTCKEANPLLGQTRAQAYAVSMPLAGLMWWGTAYLRKGDVDRRVGGWKYWRLVPGITAAINIFDIGFNLRRLGGKQ